MSAWEAAAASGIAFLAPCASLMWCIHFGQKLPLATLSHNAPVHRRVMNTRAFAISFFSGLGLVGIYALLYVNWRQLQLYRAIAT